MAADGEQQAAFKAECERIGRRDQKQAERIRGRAERLPGRSNGRAKLIAKAQALEEHAELMLAAAGAPS